jgi:hypothetical protein
MRRSESTVNSLIAVLVFGGCLVLLSGCATRDKGESTRTERASKYEKVYADPGYKGTNRRRSQTHAAPFQ